MSKFVAIMAWLSLFGLVWGMLLSDRFHTGQALAAVCLFIIIAAAASSLAAKEDQKNK